MVAHWSEDPERKGTNMLGPLEGGGGDSGGRGGVSGPRPFYIMYGLEHLLWAARGRSYPVRLVSSFFGLVLIPMGHFKNNNLKWSKHRRRWGQLNLDVTLGCIAPSLVPYRKKY